MQHVRKNRFSTKISALLIVAILALGSLPLANTSKALITPRIQFLTTSATVTEGNTILLTVVGSAAGDVIIDNGSSFSYHITDPITHLDNDTDLIFNNTPGVAAGGIAIEQGTNQFQIPVTIIDDGITEGPETIVVTLTNAQGPHGTTLGANTTFTITINDNPGLPFINFTSSASSGPENQAAILTAELSRTSTQDVIFQWTVGYTETTAQTQAITLGGNTFPADFTNAPIVLTDNGIIPAGQLTATINLGIQDDNLYEPSEDIKVGIAGILTNAQYGNDTYHTYTIIDNDTPTIQFASAGTSGDERNPSHTFFVTFSNPSYEEAELTIATNGVSTAQDGDLSVDGNDWNLPNSMRIMPAGQTSLPVTIAIKDDADTEGDETAVVTIQFPPQGFNPGSILDYTYTIIDDESLPPVTAGASGTAIPQSTASAGGAPVVTAPTAPTTPTTPVTPTQPEQNSGEVLGVQTSLLHELIAKLKFGSTSNEVTQLQVELQKLGFFPAKAKTTRFYGVVTKAAVQKYLDTKANEISLPDLAAMLKLGQRGAAVKKLQTELKTAGFFPASTAATGFYGNTTKQAVAKYLAR